MKRIGRFNVRLVNDGDRYGLKDCLTHNGKPMIEFYDSRYEGNDFGPRGQFVSRYYVETLEHHKGGLCLHGGVPDWSIPADQVKQAIEFAKQA